MADPIELPRDLSIASVGGVSLAGHFLTMAGSEVHRAIELLELMGFADPALLEQLSAARNVIAYGRMALDAALGVERAIRLDVSNERALEDMATARAGLEAERLR